MKTDARYGGLDATDPLHKRWFPPLQYKGLPLLLEERASVWGMDLWDPAQLTHQVNMRNTAVRYTRGNKGGGGSVG